MYETIVYDNFKTLVNKTGVFVLLDMESCFACSEYMKELKKYNKDGWTIVAMTKESSVDLFNSENIKPPITRLYVNDKIEWEMLGILYHTQIKELYNKISTFQFKNGSNKPVLSDVDFNVFKARHKPIDVQCIKVNEFLNVELLGQEVIARNGEYIVLYPDNTIEVIGESKFERLYEINE